MQLTYPELIVFDWDGTLVDTFDLLFSAHNYVRQAMGLTPWSQEQARQNIRASAREIYPQIYGSGASRALDLLYDYVDKHHLRKLACMPSAGELLTHLHNETAIKLAVLSNKNQLYLEREIAQLNWQDYFHAVIGAGIAEYDKPSAAPLNYMIEKLAAMDVTIPAKNRIWLIGDTETDMMCAHAAQVTPVFVRNGFGHDNIIETYTPNCVINDCKGLYHVLQNKEIKMCNSKLV